jgi:hypothetical protein
MRSHNQNIAKSAAYRGGTGDPHLGRIRDGQDCVPDRPVENSNLEPVS